MLSHKTKTKLKRSVKWQVSGNNSLWFHPYEKVFSSAVRINNTAASSQVGLLPLQCPRAANCFIEGTLTTFVLIRLRSNTVIQRYTVLDDLYALKVLSFIFNKR